LIGSIRLLLTGEADRLTAKARGRDEPRSGLVRLAMDEFLDAADSAAQQEAEHILVVVVAGGALVEVAAAPSAERQAA
jgi:hypothetical protein